MLGTVVIVHNYFVTVLSVAHVIFTLFFQVDEHYHDGTWVMCSDFVPDCRIWRRCCLQSYLNTGRWSKISCQKKAAKWLGKLRWSRCVISALQSQPSGIQSLTLIVCWPETLNCDELWAFLFLLCQPDPESSDKICQLKSVAKICRLTSVLLRWNLMLEDSSRNVTVFHLNCEGV